MTDVAAVAVRFNEAITGRDVDALGALMSEGHRFVDTAGNAVTGRTECMDAWRGFFGGYPGYRNVFESVRVDGDVATISGHSVCAGHPELEGPALWTAVVDGAEVVEWRVYDDTPETRTRLRID